MNVPEGALRMELGPILWRICAGSLDLILRRQISELYTISIEQMSDRVVKSRDRDPVVDLGLQQARFRSGNSGLGIQQKEDRLSP